MDNHTKRVLMIMLQMTRTSNLLLLLLLPRTASHTTKYIHQCDSPLVRLLGGEGTIPKSTQYVTVVTDTTQ